MKTSFFEKYILSKSLFFERFETFFSDIKEFEKKFIKESFKKKNLAEIYTLFFGNSGKQRIYAFEVSEKNLTQSEIDALFKKIIEQENPTTTKLLFFLACLKLLYLSTSQEKKSKENAQKILKTWKERFKSLKEPYIHSFLSIFKKVRLPPLKYRELYPEKLENILLEFEISLELLSVFHTLVILEEGVNRIFEGTRKKEELSLEYASEYFQGLINTEKNKKKFEKAIKEISSNLEKIMGFEKEALVEKEKSIFEEIRNTIGYHSKESEKELLNSIDTGKIFSIIDILKERTSKTLRSLGILLNDYKRIEREKKRTYIDSEYFLSLFSRSKRLPHLVILKREWDWYSELNIEYNKRKKIFESYFFDTYLTYKKMNLDTFPFERYIKREFLSTGTFFEDIESNLRTFFNEFVENFILEKILLNSIIFFPHDKEELPEPYRNSASEWIAFKKLPESEYFILNTGQKLDIEIFRDKEQGAETWFQNNVGNIVIVLAYDIRGSTFMSLKLLDPHKETEIKNLYNKQMINCIKKYGGFLVKDTGDGGIVWFGGNSKELYNELFEEGHLPKGGIFRLTKGLEKEFPILPSRDAPMRAVLCAKEMLIKSHQFIKENYSNYRDWFPDVLEDAPPLKALFRIGIGITGGLSHKDVILGYNAFGDIDLIGPIVNIASFLSEGKTPYRSVIYIDSAALGSFIMNSEDWEIYPQDSKEDEFQKIKNILLQMKKITPIKFPQKRINFYLKGMDILDEPDKSKAFSLEIPEEIEFKDGEILYKKQRVRLIYEMEIEEE